MQKSQNIAIVGGGPSGLMAAEIAAQAGYTVDIYDRMAYPARKFLMAGRGGLNLTHSEEIQCFITRYGKAEEWIAPYIFSFTPDDLRKWCESLGEETFIGSSGRVFPKSMKASPLLRAWLKKLDLLGVRYHGMCDWQGWEDDKLVFTNPKADKLFIQADATILALGGASWPKLGSNGRWTSILAEKHITMNSFRPANSGFLVNWSDHFIDKFAGMPLKPVAIKFADKLRQGEAIISKEGIEGGVVYALSAVLRDAIENRGVAEILIDLRPDMSLAELTKKLQTPRGSKSLSGYLKKLRFSDLAIGLLRETTQKEDLKNISSELLAKKLKSLPLKLVGTTGIERAISSAGGICLDELNEDLMLKKLKGVFVAGEMIDWEAPTGGYLLQGCFSSAVAAASGVKKYLQKKTPAKT